MFNLAVIVLGGSGIIAQVLILREFMVTFSGNELSIGIILANWLILEALGSYLAGRIIGHRRSQMITFVVITVIFSIFFPSVIYAVRIIKSIITPVSGEGLGLFTIFYTSFFLLIPVSLLHGGLFTIACRIYADLKDVAAIAIGKVYTMEILGTVGGGIVLTFLLLPHVLSFQIALVVSLINFVALSLAVYERRVIVLPVVLTIISALLILSPLSNRIEQKSIRKRFFDQDVLFYKDSYYGNIAVTEMAGQKTFYANGIPAFTTPYPDIAFVEESVHLPLLFLKRPIDVLIISGGAGGIINEFMKYDLRSIEYVEIDPLLLTVIRSFPDPLTQREINNDLVSIRNTDGRLYLKNTGRKFDVIVTGQSAPSDLQANRLFSLEFFELAKERLKPDGILILHLPGSLTYLSDNLKSINVSIMNTLKSVFDQVFVIPGDHNIILASNDIKFSNAGIDDLIKRFKERGLDLNFISEGQIRYRLSDYWQAWFGKEITGFRASTNHDFKPMAMLYTIEYWTAARAPLVEKILKRFESVGGNLIIYFGIILLSIFLLNLGFRFAGKEAAIDTAIFGTGFSGMVFQLILIFGFQILYGYVYYMISLLITAMMAGIASGSISATRRLKKGGGTFRGFLVLDLSVAVFAVLIIGVVVLLKASDLPSIVSEVVFIVLSFLSGIMIGAQFPIANKLVLKSRDHLAKTVGWLYAADLIGGWVGGMLAGIILLPILGLIQTLGVVIIIKTFTVVLLYQNK